ncbi:MAG TPA: diaminopimelate dehydrogenase, partial [Firmicutes bacterium]|nr:diaminopimelate dehydrogenase [Bacillota bacterium]
AGFRQKPGCYTMIELPVIDYLFGEREAIIEKMV